MCENCFFAVILLVGMYVCVRAFFLFTLLSIHRMASHHDKQCSRNYLIFHSIEKIFVLLGMRELQKKFGNIHGILHFSYLHLWVVCCPGYFSLFLLLFVAVCVLVIFVVVVLVDSLFEYVHSYRSSDSRGMNE